MLPDWLKESLTFVGLLALGWNIYAAFRKEGKDSRAQKLADDVKWRESRLAAEKVLADAVATEKGERVQWQLKREAELASIAGILEESTEAHKLLASIAATTQAHGGQLTQLHERLNTMQQHINNLSLHHGKP